MAKKNKEEVAKKIPGTVLLATELEAGAKTVEELAEICGIAINTVRVQLSYHLKMKGYVVEKVQEGEVTKYVITGKGDALPKPPKKEKKVVEGEPETSA